jgi:hypothetical protein
MATLKIEATSRTAAQADEVASRVTGALTTYIERKQDAAGISSGDRIALSPLKSADATTQISDRQLGAPLVTVAAVLVLLTLAGLSNVRARRNQAVTGKRPG